MDRAIASDLSYQVLELRRRRGELTTSDFDLSYRRLYRGAGVEFLPTEDASDGAHPNPPGIAVGERDAEG